MRAALLVALLLVGLASADFITHGTREDALNITADYLQEAGTIDYEASELQTPYSAYRLSTIGVAVDGAGRIIAETVGLPAGTYRYLLVASDSEGNRASHPVTIDISQATPFTILSPSPTGIADRPGLSLAINTTADATCRWAFHDPTRDATLRPMDADGTTRTVPGSETIVPPEGETVPILIDCDGSRRVIPLGWDARRYEASAQYHPRTAGSDLDTLIITAHAQSLAETGISDCRLRGGTQNTRSEGLSEHSFGYVAAGVNDQGYSITCTSPAGDELPTAWLPRPVYSQAPLIAEPLRPLDIQNRTDVTVAVLTQLPAHCTATLGGSSHALGPLRDGREHQGLLTLPADATTTVAVTCTADNQDLTASTELHVAVDTTPPTVSVPTGTYCAASRTAVLSVNAPDAQSLLITAGERSVLRENAGTITLHRLLQENTPLSVRGIDAAGNLGPAVTRPLIEDPDPSCGIATVPNWVGIASPAEGATQAQEFTLVVESLHQSACTYDLGDGPSAFTQSDGRFHTEPDFQTLLPGPGEHPITISCANGTNTATIAQSIAWQAPRPSIDLEADPEPVVDVVAQTTNLTIMSDQEVRCAISTDEGFRSTTGYYGNAHTVPVAVPYGSVQVVATANCSNRAGLWTVGRATIREDYPTLLEIVSVDAPAVTSEHAPQVRALTNRPALCTASSGSAEADLTQRAGISHLGTITLAEGEHDVTINCSEPADDTRWRSRQITITVDTTAPRVNLTSRSYTCGLDTLIVQADVNDPSGIANYTAWFDNKTYTRTRIPFTIDHLDLEENTTYTLVFTATDRAGNTPAKNVSMPIQARTEDDGSCDFTPPYAYLREHERNDGVEVWLVCYDDEGCADDIEIGFGAWDGRCELESASLSKNETYVLEETTKVCWRVEDVNGNAFEDEEVVLVKERPEHCTDGRASGDETGIDCGGSCVSCEDDLAGACSNGVLDGEETDVDCGGGECSRCGAEATCEIDLDCASYNCVSGSCQASTCDDGVKNGAETDVDCGGGVCGACDEGATCSTDSDCETGVCSGRTCTAQRLSQEYPDPGEEPQKPFTDEDGGALGIILIILGVLIAGGGGGYIWYEREHEEAGGTAAQPVGGMPESFAPRAIEDEDDDYASSELREKARKKRREERVQDRKSLLEAFKEKPKKGPKPAPKQDAVSQENETVHKQLQRAETPEAIKELAQSLLGKGEAEKHELASALADLRAHDKLDEDALESLRKELGL